jgi:hypothetical protein
MQRLSDSRRSGAVRVALGYALFAGSVASGTAVTGDVAQYAPAGSVSAENCAPTHGHAFVCGAEKPEDLARIPRTRWLVFSGFSDGAGLKLVDSQARTMRRWYTGEQSQLAHDKRRFGACPSPPDAALFNTQGLSLRGVSETEHLLYVVNHGGRESIEVFRIDSSGHQPLLYWIGCVLMPEATPANSVATYSDGTILASVLTRPGTSITDFVRGRTTGGVYERRPGEATFRLLPGTELPGNNGIETALDDSEFYVVAFGWRAVVVFSRADASSPLRKATAPGFMPDNIHWDEGRLIVAGMQYDEPACGGVRKIINGRADEMRCHRGYVVAELSPQTLDFGIVAYAEPNPVFNGVSAARIIGAELWLGAYQGDRIAVRPLPVDAANDKPAVERPPGDSARCESAARDISSRRAGSRADCAAPSGTAASR